MKTFSKTILLAIVFSFTLLEIPAMALDYDFSVGDFYYFFSPYTDTEVGVAGYRNDSATHVTIPSTVVNEYTDYEDGNWVAAYRTCRVTLIGEEAFLGCRRLTSVTIPDSVRDISDEAFRACSGLTSVKIPDSVTSIGPSAFRECSGLRNVTIGNSVTYIWDSAFENCTNLTSVTIPDSVTSIGDAAFYECSSLGNVTIGNSVRYIADGVFSGCIGLTSVTIPESVTSIGETVFYGCSGLTSMTIPDSVTNIGVGVFGGCSGLTNVVLSGNLTSIESSAFEDCTGLTSVTIPDGVTSIEYGAFDGCSGLTNVMLPGSLTSIGKWAFEDCTGLMSVTIPDSVTSIGYSAFSDCSGLTSVTIPAGVTSIEAWTFQGCSGLTNVILPGSLTSIGMWAFDDCSGLTSVTIPDSVTNIGDRAFSRCSGLTSVTIPDSVTSIGGGAFYWCTNLESVTIGNAVADIGDRPFEACSGLASVTFEGAPPRVNEEYSPFSDVAPDAQGYYTAAHVAAWEAVIVDGKWKGLTMALIGAPVLGVQSANPAEGSLTLAWDNPCPAAGVTSSVYRSANDTYAATDLVTNGLTETTWTDTNYWAAEPVLKPLNYWVVADGGGYGEWVSEPVETRNRYGISVGIGQYIVQEDNLGMAIDATLCKRFSEKHGDFSHVERIQDSDATLSTVQDHMKTMAAQTQPGDVFLFFFSGHGEAGKLLLRGTWNYTTSLLREDIAAFNPGVAVIGIVMACHSGSILSLGNWPANAAWICSCGSAQESLLFGERLVVWHDDT